MRDLVYYVATSMDGFIADPAGDFSGFGTDPQTLAALFNRYPETCPVQARAALGVDGAPQRFDTVLMGYRTYAPALDAGLPGGAYPHLAQVVATHRSLPTTGGLRAISGDVAAEVARMKQEPGADIWLCGGGELAAELIDLIDEIQLKVNPILLGSGIPVLPITGGARAYTLTATETLPGGVVLQTYRADPGA